MTKVFAAQTVRGDFMIPAVSGNSTKIPPPHEVQTLWLMNPLTLGSDGSVFIPQTSHRDLTL